MPSTVQVLVVRSGDENRHPDPEMLLGIGDVCFLEERTGLHSRPRRKCSEYRLQGPVVSDRSDMDYLHVFVSKPGLEGTMLSDLRFPEGTEATITHIQRGDTEIMVDPALTLEIGDRVGLLVHRKWFGTLRNFFGNSIRGTTEFSYISLGIGMVLGVLAGNSSHSPAFYRYDETRYCRRIAYCCTDPWKAGPYLETDMDDAAVGKSDITKLRTVHFSCPGWDEFWCSVC